MQLDCGISVYAAALSTTVSRIAKSKIQEVWWLSIAAHQAANSAVPVSNPAHPSGINPEPGRTTGQKRKKVSGDRVGSLCQLDTQKYPI